MRRRVFFVTSRAACRWNRMLLARENVDSPPAAIVVATEHKARCASVWQPMGPVDSKSQVILALLWPTLFKVRAQPMHFTFMWIPWITPIYPLFKSSRLLPLLWQHDSVQSPIFCRADTRATFDVFIWINQNDILLVFLRLLRFVVALLLHCTIKFYGCTDYVWYRMRNGGMPSNYCVAPQ